MPERSAYNDPGVLTAQKISAPELHYQPTVPKDLKRPIGLIGCGGISSTHLAAYKAMGLNIVALCDSRPERRRAECLQNEYFPDAHIYSDHKALLKRDDIEVVDIATHPHEREYLIPAAIDAGKHILSQKPFVLDLDMGEKFAEMATKKGVKLAINQNGRWAPHFSYLRQAIRRGLIGDVFAVHLACHWDHEWIKATAFNQMRHIVLYDYAIHWFDMVHCLLQKKEAKRVFASLRSAPHQTALPPLLGQAIIEFDDAQASLQFDGAVKVRAFDTGFVAGTQGVLRYEGGLKRKKVTIETSKGYALPKLKGEWFCEGFMGSMAELLSSIEQSRIPENNALDNLKGLAICFAAVVSAETGKPQSVGKIRKIRLSRKGKTAEMGA